MVTSLEQLYEDDFYAWTRHQADALRRLAETRPNADIDFAHLIEEVEELGDHRLIAVRSQTRRLIEHLLKLEHSPSAEPRLGWLRTVVNARDEIADRLTTTIRNEIEQELPKLHAKARKNAAAELRWQGEAEAAAGLPVACPFTLVQLLDEDWYPANRHGLVDG
jgi:hypothetical protein